MIFYILIIRDLLLVLCISVLTGMQITIQLGRTGIFYAPGTLTEDNCARPQIFANSVGSICPDSLLVLLFCLSWNIMQWNVWRIKYRHFNINLFFLVGHKLTRELLHLLLCPSACPGKCPAGAKIFSPGFARKFTVKTVLEAVKSPRICRFLKKKPSLNMPGWS